MFAVKEPTPTPPHSEILPFTGDKGVFIVRSVHVFRQHYKDLLVFRPACERGDRAEEVSHFSLYYSLFVCNQIFSCKQSNFYFALAEAPIMGAIIIL